MIITLKAFRDLGRCSYGTLREVFDTEKDVIYDNDKKVEVTCVEDLFPYLWQSAGISGHTPKGPFAYFHGGGTHWHSDFDSSVARYAIDLEKLQKKIDKLEECEKKYRLIEDFKSLNTHRDNLIKIIKTSDEEMAELQKALIMENQK